MTRYYTRACNFYYGRISKILVNKKKTLPLNNNKEISFDKIEIISRKSKKKILINNLNNLPKLLKKKIRFDLKNITSKKNNFANLKFQKIPNIMGFLNITPSFAPGYYNQGDGKDLGHSLEFKSEVQLSFDLGDTTNLGMSYKDKHNEQHLHHRAFFHSSLFQLFEGVNSQEDILK